MGDVINKKFDFSMSSWRWNIERYTLVQFVPIVKTVNILVWTPKNSETDFGLFIRDINSINLNFKIKTFAKKHCQNSVRIKIIL